MRITQTPPTFRSLSALSAFEGPIRMFVVNTGEPAAGF
jgi:hypothetical protein